MNPDILIEPLKKTDIADAADVVTRAFLTDPAPHIKMVWNRSDDENYARQVALFNVYLDQPYRHTFAAKINGKLVGCFAYSHHHHCHHSFLQSLHLAIPMIKAVKASLPRVMELNNS